MNPTKLITGAITLICLSSPAAQAQHPVHLLQSPGACPGASLSTFGGWQSVANGLGCPSGSSNVDRLDWSYADGPTHFDGIYFTGYGSFYIEFLDGDNVLQGYAFDAWGQDVLVNPPGFYSSVTRVRVRRESGVGAFGISSANGAGGPAAQIGPPGNGPDGNGPPGKGPDGNGPPGKGPDRSGPSDNFPPDKGPNGPTDDKLNTLVNQTNATPEPATILLVATGLGGVGALARRRRNAEQRRHG